MVCVAATRGGFGDLWLFDTRTDAFLHPLVQYGDALICSDEDVYRQYSRIEWNSLRALLGLRQEEKSWVLVDRNRRDQAVPMFAAMQAQAARPPLDPQQICDMVSRDRRTGTSMAKKKDDAPADVAPAAPANSASVPTGAKGPRGVPGDAMIRMGIDKENKHYGPDNNPKKVGSKTHGRFMGYHDGMTVAAALATGLTTADLIFDRDHGYISFEGGTIPPITAPVAAVEASAEEQTDLEQALQEPEDAEVE